MSRLERLIAIFEEVARRPWSASLAGPQRVWMVVYDPADERRLRNRLPEFEHAAAASGHPIRWCDVTDAFAKWMAEHEYRDAYFEAPEDLLSDEDGPVASFREYVAERVRGVLSDTDETELVGLTGVATLFGLIRVSAVIEEVQDEIPGRLVVFFPGALHDNTYRLLDARDGWTYLALPITV